PDFLIIGRTNAVRASTMDDALRRGEAYRKAGADLVLLSMARTPEQLRLIAERLGAPLMYLTGRGGLAALGMSLKDLGALGYRIVADPSTPLWAGYAAWKKVYADLADDFGAKAQKTDWTAVEHEVLGLIALALTVGACSVLSGVVAQVLDYRAAEFDVAIERGVAVVTSDGVRLRSDVFLPKGAARIPTILVRVPLDKTTTNTAFATTV